MAPGQTLANVFEERAPLYEKYADITVHCSRAPLEKTVERILRALEE
jgi:shikimate kinase